MRKLVKNVSLPALLAFAATPSQAQESGLAGDTVSTMLSDLMAFAQDNPMLLGGGVAVLVVFLVVRMFSGRRREKAPDTLAIHSLVAMSQVAIADGRIDDTEVNNISQILTRLTGNSYGPQQVMEMLQRLNPSAADLAQVGQDLSEKDRQIVLEAALNIAVADGEIHPSEYAVVSDLAQRMRIGSDQFRQAMARISAHLQTVQPV